MAALQDKLGLTDRERPGLGGRYDREVAHRKLSITLPAALAEDVVRLTRDRGLPVSAWLAEAAAEARRHQAALAAIAGYEEEFGA